MNDGTTPAPPKGATQEGRFAREDERSVADLFKDLSEQTTTLIRQELELARAEVTEKGKRAGMGAGMFGAAGFLGFFAFAALTATFILGLSEAVDAWLAALIVTAAYGAIAGVLALIGRGQVRRATPPIPEQAKESVREDVEWTRTRARAARS